MDKVARAALGLASSFVNTNKKTTAAVDSHTAFVKPSCALLDPTVVTMTKDGRFLHNLNIQIRSRCFEVPEIEHLILVRLCNM